MHGVGARQPSSDVLEDQQRPEDVRATSSFVAGARALPAAWQSQDTDLDYPVPGQRGPPRPPTPVQEYRAQKRLTAAEEADALDLEQHLTELRPVNCYKCYK